MSYLIKFELNPINSLSANARKLLDQLRGQETVVIQQSVAKVYQAWEVPQWM